MPLTDPVETGGEAVTEPTICTLPLEVRPPDETVALPDGVSSLEVGLTPAEGAPDEIVRVAFELGAAAASLPVDAPEADVPTGNALEPLVNVGFALAETDSITLGETEAEGGGEPVGSLTGSVDEGADDETDSPGTLELVGTGRAAGISVALAGRGSVSETVEETEIGTGTPAVPFETTLVTGSIGPSDAVGAAFGGGGGWVVADAVPARTNVEEAVSSPTIETTEPSLTVETKLTWIVSVLLGTATGLAA